MFMEMYAAPALPPTLDGTGEMCTATDRLGCAPCMLGFRGLGDPFGFTDIATALTNFAVAKQNQKLQQAQLDLQEREQKAQEAQTAHDQALQQAQAAVDQTTRTRNTTVYALTAVGAVGAIIGTVFLLSALKGKKK